MKVGRAIQSCLILISVLSGVMPGRDSQSLEPANKITDSLELPSFSIFGLPLSTAENDVKDLLDPTVLKKFLAEVEKDRARKVTKEDYYFWVIPRVFYQARTLFAKDSWTSEEIQQAQYIAEFFSKLAKRPDLKIDRFDQQPFRNQLVRLRNWFVSLCQNNKTLAAMIFTLDHGPFFGGEIDTTRVSEISLVESVPIPAQQASFALMKDGTQPEPMIVGVINGDKSIRWLKRFSASPTGRIADATLEKCNISKLEGYGYAVRLTADWSAGTESGCFYLDESLNLRFYYLSW